MKTQIIYFLKKTKQTKVFDYVIIVDKPYFGELGDLLGFLSLPSS